MAEVLVTGAGGMVGKALCARLRERGDGVRTLSRSGGDDRTYVWDPSAGRIDHEALRGVDAVVHLAGESIAQRFTEARKRRILESRRKGTELLCRAIADAEAPPRTLVSASAIGFYGDRGDEWLDEDAPPGEGFLADVCRVWEDATVAAQDAGVRVVRLRIGVVLDPDDGALSMMLPPFRLGLGGPVGTGRQFMSWITLRDLVGLMLHALDNESVSGPLNAVAPNPVRNREFGRVLGRVLRRPAIVPLPAFAVRTLLGEMGERLLLDGARVSADRARESGYRFEDPELELALSRLLS